MSSRAYGELPGLRVEEEGRQTVEAVAGQQHVHGLVGLDAVFGVASDVAEVAQLELKRPCLGDAGKIVVCRTGQSLRGLSCCDSLSRS